MIDQPQILTIRLYSGLSGDMFLAGLLKMTELEESELNKTLLAILPDLSNSVHLIQREVGHISGWSAEVTLTEQHQHRTLTEIKEIITTSTLTETGKDLAQKTFTLLARAEGEVHGLRPEEVHFHEVGALDSILDICLTCELYALLNPVRLVVSPLPLADGAIQCAHGILPVPAPAVVKMLNGIPVRPFSGEGETVTPTALALLRTLGAEFGSWPWMRVEKQALIYGTHIFANAPNGALFALGSAIE